jgi:hypothetical protein
LVQNWFFTPQGQYILAFGVEYTNTCNVIGEIGETQSRSRVPVYPVFGKY